MCLLLSASNSLLESDSLEEVMQIIKTGNFNIIDLFLLSLSLLISFIFSFSVSLSFTSRCLDLPGLGAEGLEDVIKEAATLNVARQLNKYEVSLALI